MKAALRAGKKLPRHDFLGGVHIRIVNGLGTTISLGCRKFGNFNKSMSLDSSKPKVPAGR